MEQTSAAVKAPNNNMKKFHGMYFKHQKDGCTVSFIAGISDDHAFIQLITNQSSFYFSYPLLAYEPGEIIKIGDNSFSKNGISVNISEDGVSIFGEIRYTSLTPLRYDIIGPFKYLPMQYGHTITSLHHRLDGNLTIYDENVNFTDGVGYIEGNFGTSFPKSYVWIQCNDFPEKACIFASIADIPFAGLHFRGCICVVYIDGIEYRMATYLGVKILRCDDRMIVLKQGSLHLEIEIDAGTGHKLMAPQNGKMIREIRERIVCGARFRFVKNGEVLFDGHSGSASFEHVG